MATPTTKRIDYAYPTSSYARALGFNTTGCYTVERREPGTVKPIALRGFSTLSEAREYAETIDLPWDKLTK